MTSVADLLPETFARTRVEIGTIWAYEIPLDPALALKAVRAVFDLEFPRAYEVGLAAVLELARSVRGDILLDVSGALAGSDYRDRALVLLEISSMAATCALDASNPADAYDWLIYGLSEAWDVEGDVELFMNRCTEALSSPTFAFQAQDVVDVWLTALFSYDAAVAGLRSTAMTHAPVVMQMLHQHEVSERLGLVGAFLDWVSRLSSNLRAEIAGLSIFCRNTGEALAQLVTSAATQNDVDPIAVSILAFTPEDVTAQVQATFREKLLSLPASKVRPVDRLDALIASFGSAEAMLEHLDELIQIVADYSSAIAVSDDDVATRQRRTTELSHVAPALHMLLNAGNVTEAVRILATWLRPGEDETALRGDSILVCYRHDAGTTWIGDGIAASSGSGSEAAEEAWDSQARFVEAANAFLRTSLISPDHPVPPKLPLGVRGVPDPKAGPEFAEAASDYAAIRRLPPVGQSSIAARNYSDSGAMLVLPSLAAPIQGLMVRELGWTRPLSMSLRDPLPDRHVRSALVWLQGSLFNQREVDELVPRLEAAGISVDVRTQADMTRARFMSDYTSPDYDLVWVGCHGEVPPFAPTKASLEVAPNGGVGLADLAPPEWADVEGRRLLVLNACDSAAAFHYGGIGDLSLAGAAAGRTQAVVAHMWPIGSPVVAPVFAAAFAEGLCAGQSFFGAYNATMRSLARGAIAVGASLSLSQSVAHEMEDHPDMLDGLAGWASAAFII